MRSMIKRLKCYLDKKRLTLNTRKTKVMRFRKRGGKMKNAEWKWKDERIEEVVEFEYLGYTLKVMGEGNAGKRKGEESGSGNEASMGSRQEEISEGLEKKNVVILQNILQISMVGHELWDRDMGVEKKGKDRRDRREVY